MFTDNQRKCLSDVFKLKHDSKNIDRKIYLSMKKLTEKSDDTKVTGSFKIVERMGDPIKYLNSFTDIIYSLLFMDANHENACVPFADELRRKMDILKIGGYENFFSYFVNSGFLNVPEYFVNDFGQGMANDKCDFIIFPVFLFEKYGVSVTHYNMCIYNKREKSLERFEPRGSLSMGEFDLDEKLELFFNKKFPDVVDKYYAPIDICPIAGFQRMQVDEGDVIENDPVGFCLAWSVWYVDLRLFNPKKSQKQVIDFALKVFRENNMGLTKFIRTYNDAFRVFAKNFMQKNITLDMIKKYGNVYMYTLEGCSACEQAKKFLRKNMIYFTSISVVDDKFKIPDGREADFTTFSHISRITGKSDNTFPIIYIQKNIFLGGFSDLQALHDSK